MSSWAAFKERAKLKDGETVLINGATGAAARLAVQIARHFGAAKVIATGRNLETLKSVAALGADVTIPLVEDGSLETAFEKQFAAGVDVVIDFLWGPSAERLLIAGTKGGKAAVSIRFVQVGSVSGSNITLPSAALRSSAITLMGSGIGSVPVERLVDAVRELLHATVPGGFQIGAKAVPLSEVEPAWRDSDSTRRTGSL